MTAGKFRKALASEGKQCMEDRRERTESVRPARSVCCLCATLIKGRIIKKGDVEVIDYFLLTSQLLSWWQYLVTAINYILF